MKPMPDGPCPTDTFQLDYRYRTYASDIKCLVVEMAINTKGIRDTRRVSGINKSIVINTLKKTVNITKYTLSLRTPTVPKDKIVLLEPFAK